MSGVSPRKPRRWPLLGCIFAAAAVLLYFGRTPLLTGMGQWLDVGQRPAPADYVMILPGGEDTRPLVAAALVKRGYGRQALIPKTAASPEVSDGLAPPTVEVIRRVLLQRGLRDSQIVAIESRSSSTWEDAEALGAFLRSRPNATALAVTHHHHTRRARWVFRRVLGRDAGRITFVSAPSDDFAAANWWRSKTGLQAVSSEYLKFTFYLVRYGDVRVWWVVGVAAAWLAVRGFRRLRGPRNQPASSPEPYQAISMPAVGPWNQVSPSTSALRPSLAPSTKSV
jgi:uncharacterized SAM-binding protein YcdF (DUF218 family)